MNALHAHHPSGPRARSGAGRFPSPWMLLLALVFAAVPAAADEGMWTLDHPPLDALRERYGFEPTPQWLERMRLSSVSFGGGSGAFVSPSGLVVTNQHVARRWLYRLSGEGRDLVGDGFSARTPEEERPVPGLELRVLVSTEDVTARVREAVDSSAPPAGQDRQRRAAIAAIEQASTRERGLESKVVELYRGGEFWLHRFRVHTDVRLVWAPEEQAASFGGDPDNFGFPRHDLDIAFFRIYENGRPLRTDHWMPWRTEGSAEGDLVFAFGHPGSTNRLATVSQLEFRRDVHLPIRIRRQEAQLAALREFARLGDEEARQTHQRVMGLENNLKRERAYREVLSEPAVLEAIRAAEGRLRARVESSGGDAAEARGAWERIAAAGHEARGRWAAWLYADMSRVAGLLDHAVGLVRYAEETAKPNEARWPEYREQNLPSRRRALLSPAPDYRGLDTHLLTAMLTDMRAVLGADAPLVRTALAGRDPAALAREVIGGTRLDDPAVRRKLLEGGRRAVERSRDPLIVFARRVGALYREMRDWEEHEVQAVVTLEGGRIARSRFALDGRSNYPDATGTLRLSYGRVAGYPQLGSRVPWATNFYSLYGRSEAFGAQPPYDLPAPLSEARDRLRLATAFNFVCTADIIGGSSGSPIVDREGRLVGIVFDGNAQAFRWDVLYDDAQARCVAVHPAGVIEALRVVYGMDVLADELEARAMP